MLVIAKFGACRKNAEDPYKLERSRLATTAFKYDFIVRINASIKRLLIDSWYNSPVPRY